MGDYHQSAAVQGRTNGNRANVIPQSHPTGLTASLLNLFQPRPPLEFKPPPQKRKRLPYTGIAQLVSQFADPEDPEYAPPVQKGETPAERKARIHKSRLENGAKKVAEELETYDPNNDPNVSGDAYKTLFIGRLSYETTESRLRKEFEGYGPIKRVRLVTDKSTSRPRGYAFIEYARTRDMKAAYKQTDGMKIDNHRILVDVERGRTVPNWRPRRLGGGLGTARVRDADREKSPEKVRERENRDREKSRERVRESRERSRDREHREDRHQYRERERSRDREKERDRRSRDRGGRDRGRDY